MEEWKEYKLGDVCSRLSSGKNISASKISTSSIYPVYGGNGLRGYTDVSNFTGDCAIIGRQGAFCGNVRYFSGEAYMTEHAVIVCGNEKANTRYLAYLLSTMNLGRLSGQSAQPGLAVGTLSKQLINLPALPTQQKIATILSSLDDKIELNNKINENLEQQAQALFKSWFVDNDSNLTETEIGKLDILITDYVANGSFKDLADNVKYLTEETNNVLIRLTDYNNNFSSDMVYISDESYDFLEKSKLYGDEIIISNVGANVGTVFRCPRLSKRMNLAPNSIMIRANNYEHYLYLFFTSAYGQGLLKSIVTGSAQPKFNKTNFRSLKIKIPNEEQLSKFNNIYDSIHEKIINIQKENLNLASIRDTLLPKLMNGEIEVL